MAVLSEKVISAWGIIQDLFFEMMNSDVVSGFMLVLFVFAVISLIVMLIGFRRGK